MSGIARRETAPDPTIYPVSEKVPESTLAREVANLLWKLTERFLAERGEVARVGSDQFIYYRQHDSSARVAPDLYVLPGVDPETRIGAWKIWETGVVPTVAVEVVSIDVRKDYEESPLRHDEMGVRELIVYDPDHERGPDRVLFQIYRRRGPKLAFVEATNRDRIRSKVLGCFLRSVGEGTHRRLRISTGPRGEDLFPTVEELAAAAQDLAAAAVERADAAEEAAAAAEERAAAAEAELARLRAELAKPR
jgi:hypothetical protein